LGGGAERLELLAVRLQGAGPLLHARDQRQALGPRRLLLGEGDQAQRLQGAVAGQGLVEQAQGGLRQRPPHLGRGRLRPGPGPARVRASVFRRRGSTAKSRARSATAWKAAGRSPARAARSRASRRATKRRAGLSVVARACCSSVAASSRAAAASPSARAYSSLKILRMAFSARAWVGPSGTGARAAGAWATPDGPEAHASASKVRPLHRARPPP